MEVTIVIPAYNEADNLEQVVIPLKEFAIANDFKIIVVNDGSDDNSKELIDQFPQWLSMGARNGGFVLVLDALNQLDSNNNAMDLNWLPTTFPHNVKLVVSCLPGQARDVLKKRGWTILEVQPLTKSGQIIFYFSFFSIFYFFRFNFFFRKKNFSY